MNQLCIWVIIQVLDLPIIWETIPIKHKSEPRAIPGVNSLRINFLIYQLCLRWIEIYPIWESNREVIKFYLENHLVVYNLARGSAVRLYQVYWLRKDSSFGRELCERHGSGYGLVEPVEEDFVPEPSCHLVTFGGLLLEPKGRQRTQSMAWRGC